jgi:hypothetical protein
MMAIMQWSFGGLTLVVIMALAWCIASGAGFRAALKFLLLLGFWFLYSGALSATGVLAAPGRPPGFIWVAVPMLAFLLFLTVTRLGAVATSLPLWTLLGIQVFRLPLELLLHALWRAEVIPRMMTYQGSNFDIVMGATAPLMAFGVWRKAVPLKVVLGWNILGLALVANVAVRGILTSPAVALIDADFPNTAIVTFPFSFVATFCVPLALALHIVCLKRMAIADRRVLEKSFFNRA